MSFIMANSAIILGIMWGISELLASIPSVKANSIFQLVFNVLKAKAEKKEA